MKPETEQLLGTLEVIGCQTFLWKTETQGEFTPWNLMISEGFVNLTDVERAFEYWQNIEQWGTPTNQKDYEYAPLRSERKDDWNEAIATERQGYYQQLQQLLTAHLQNLQAYNLSIPNSSRHSFEWSHPNFSVSIVVGETRNRQWLCIAPTVPNQVGFYRRNRGKLATIAAIVCEPSSDTMQMVSQIQPILDKLNPIPIYGYYYGGYKYTYLHQIVYTVSPAKDHAIEQALRAAEMLIVSKLDGDRGEYNDPKLYQFLTSSLQNFKVYQLCFWDIGYIYELGQTATGDWLGVCSPAEFEYNP